MTFIIAFAGQKGGAGKSTCAIATAAEWHARGRSVLLVDADQQSTSLTWADMATEHGHDSPTVVRMGEGLHKEDQLPRLAKGFDVVVIDCPGRSGKVQRAALMVSDLAILPCGPGAADAWALAESADLVTEAQVYRPSLQARVLITRIQARTALGEGARESLGQAGLPLMKTELGFRVAYQEAPAAGQGVAQYAPGSRAAQEVAELVDEIDAIAEASRIHVAS